MVWAWLVASIPLKNINQWEGLSHILWKIKMFQTTNQIIEIHVHYISLYQIISSIAHEKPSPLYVHVPLNLFFGLVITSSPASNRPPLSLRHCASNASVDACAAAQVPSGSPGVLHGVFTHEETVHD